MCVERERESRCPRSCVRTVPTVVAHAANPHRPDVMTKWVALSMSHRRCRIARSWLSHPAPTVRTPSRSRGHGPPVPLARVLHPGVSTPGGRHARIGPKRHPRGRRRAGRHRRGPRLERVFPATRSSVSPTRPCASHARRVRAALLSSELTWPMQRITVNLAPGDIPKRGSGLEVAVALGLLRGRSKRCPPDVLHGVGVVGELGLDGSIRAVPGVLAIVDAARRPRVHDGGGARRLCRRGRSGPGVGIRTARSIGELRACLKDEEPWPPIPDRPCPTDPKRRYHSTSRRSTGSPRRAPRSYAAAAGGHHLLMVGPPGVGKTMLAQRIPGIMTPLDSGRRPRGHADPISRRSSVPPERSPPPHRFAPRITRPAPRRSSVADRFAPAPAR